jgi:hypothetical protein
MKGLHQGHGKDPTVLSRCAPDKLVNQLAFNTHVL